MYFFFFLGFAGRNKNGKKHELQARALELVKIRSTPMQTKIRELYKASQESQAAENMMGQNGQPLYPGLNYNNMTAAAMMSLGGAYAATQQASLQGRNPYTPATGYPGQVHQNMFTSPYQVFDCHSFLHKTFIELKFLLFSNLHSNLIIH